MAVLRAFMSNLSVIVEQGKPMIYAQACVLSDAVLVLDARGEAVDMRSAALLVPTDTLAQMRAKVEAVAEASFNSKLGRTDGNKIVFVWLDDKGLL